MSGLSSNAHNYKTIQGGFEFTVSAPGKVILHGEHSVVYGKLAVAASLGLRTKIHLVEIDCPNTLILKMLPVAFEHTFSLEDIKKRLLDKPQSVNTKIADFNWETPKLVNHEKHLELVEEAVNSYDVGASKAAKCILYMLSGILSSVDINLESMCITLDSELSMGAGTGSSASFSVAFSALFIHYLKMKTRNLKNISKSGFKPFSWETCESYSDTSFSNRELAAISDWAFCGEKLFHGTPSGLDNTICTYGNLVKYRKNDSTTHLALNAPINLLLINTKVPRTTIKMVEIVAKLKLDFPRVVEHILDALEDLTVSALDVIKQIDGASGNKLEQHYEAWETLIHMNHSLLCSLGVSHQKLEEINVILRRHSLKGKLTGAGGGGFAISILKPSYDPEEVIRILKEHDFEVIATKLGGQGVRVD